MSLVVAIPVNNERDHIQLCLQALDAQRGVARDSFGVVLFLNNCDDGTETVLDRIIPTLSYPVRILVRDDPDASAGWARRHAMEAAASWLDEEIGDASGNNNAILLTTDADSRVPDDWLARNHAALQAGADLVAGRLALDPNDAAALPLSVRTRGALEAQYELVANEIAARLDPVPGDPWPTHACHSGASLATRLDIYRVVGGMPDMPCGEDRAFVEAVLAHDGVVRHDPDIVVVTSGRLSGRAKGGVADTIRLRCDKPESPCDDRLERVGRIVARALLSRHLRRLHGAGAVGHIERVIQNLASDCEPKTTLGSLHFALQRSSPHLEYRPLCPSALPDEIRRGRRFLRLLRSGQDQLPRRECIGIGPGRIAEEACG